MHTDQEGPVIIEAWPEDWANTAQEVPPQAPPPEPEQPDIPLWFVALVALILWGPLAGAAFRPYRPPG